ncbi:YitT family protein [Microbacterium forte]
MTSARAVSQEWPESVRHTLLEDALSIAVGTFLVSLGLFLLKTGHAVTGGTAGAALLLSYAVPLPFAALYIAVNLPFFLLAARGKGWGFVVRSGISIVLVSAMSLLHPLMTPLAEIPTLYAAIAGNALCGVGALIVFRHRSSLGGFTIAALMVQDRFGIRAGYVLMVLDTIVVVAAIAVVPLLNVAISAVGAVLLNLILALNHRPGRYFGGESAHP